MSREASDKLKRLSNLDALSGPLYCLDDGIGCIELSGMMGDDETIVRAARVSFAAEKEEIVPDRLKGMIRFMMINKHGSVFEHNTVRFLVKMPIFVIREWHRHRTMSYNEVSGRYSVLEPEFYVPRHIRTQVGKPGAYTFEPVEEGFVYDVTRGLIEENGRQAYETYLALLPMIAKEQARLVLPVNLYSKFYATANLRNWMRFLELRNSEHAMYEIRRAAVAIEHVLAALYPEVMAAFVENGRIAP